MKWLGSCQENNVLITVAVWEYVNKIYVHQTYFVSVWLKIVNQTVIFVQKKIIHAFWYSHSDMEYLASDIQCYIQPKTQMMNNTYQWHEFI